MTGLIGLFRTIGIAAVAAFAAVAGAALAGPSGTTANVTPAQVKKIAKTVAGAEIRRLAPRLSVQNARSAHTARTANIAGRAGTADTATTAQVATTAEAARAPAVYAQVTGAGVVTANARGIGQANVTHPKPGFYCFSGLPFTIRGGLVTVDSNVPGGGSGPDLAQLGLSTVTGCPAGTQAHVVIFPRDEGPFVDDPFFVVLWV
ncbi:MAG TPA: hypothetical protein VFR32_10535 [Gaiellaceae bacterium]|nr:hypothetical protein [Gaiellaceae bacterium]